VAEFAKLGLLRQLGTIDANGPFAGAGGIDYGR